MHITFVYFICNIYFTKDWTVPKNTFLSYPLSKIGHTCDNPIKTNEECKEASESLERTIYVGTKGDGVQLPRGCVFDNVTPRKTYVYWNKDGGVKSYDPKLRTICQPMRN